MKISEVEQLGSQIVNAVGQAVVGKDEVLYQVLMGLLADGHILIEDYPGLAKTLIVGSFAQVMDVCFKRIQFTPDLLPGEVTGGYIYNQKESAFEFKSGPIFTNLLLADEINRATPKTQAALLEGMQEKQVTVEGESHRLGRPFSVIATQNPIEFEGTYPLPEAQLDRFIMRLGVGYPRPEDELEMLRRRGERKEDATDLAAIIDASTFVEMQRATEEVHVGQEIGKYIVDIIGETRKDSRIQVGASPRGSIAIFKLARTSAILAGRDFVTPEDVKAVSSQALVHRIILRPELWATQTLPEEVVDNILKRVPAPRL